MHTFITLAKVATVSPWLHALSCLVLKLAALAMRVKPDGTSLVPPGCVERAKRLRVLAARAKLDACSETRSICQTR